MNENEEKNIQENSMVNNDSNSTVNAIANSEARDENAERVEGAKSNTNADFSSMFGVASEETQEEKDLKKETRAIDIPRVLEVKEEAPKEVITEEQKKANRQKTFNGEERLVYKIEEEKQGSPIVVVLFFIMLITFIVILPNISKKIDFGGFFKNNSQNNSGDSESEESEFLRIESAASRAKIGNLEMINFVRHQTNDKREYKISFTIQNVGEKIYQFDKKYYFVLYSDEKPLYYALIHSYNGIPPKSAQDIELTISKRAYESANRFRVEEIPVSKYPDVNLNEVDGEYRVLTCEYLNNEIKYYFINNKLERIKDVSSETRSEYEATFDADLERYKGLTEKYKKLTGFESIIVEDEDSFSQNNSFGLESISDFDLQALKEYRFFRYNTHKNVVSFEIEARGYVCR